MDDDFNSSMLEDKIDRDDRDAERTKKIIAQYWAWHDCMVEMNDLTAGEDRKYKKFLKVSYGITEGDLRDGR